MKKILTLVFALTMVMGYAQDPMLQQSNETLDDEATKITQEYNDQLSLTGKQFMLFQKKVEEFLIRREKIENEFKGKDKLDLLFALQKQETIEMSNILTQPQLDLYKRIKSKIQPLAIAEEK